MISGKDVYDVVSAVTPLYMAMFLAYGSVRWWGMFTPAQCAVINRYVAMFALPFLGFNVIASSNLYALNFKFVLADTLQKVAVLLALAIWSFAVSMTKDSTVGGGGAGLEDWTSTLFSLTSLPNTLIVGIPLLTAMYGDYATDLIIQLIVLQATVWYNLLLFFFEYRAAKILKDDHFPGSNRDILPINVDPDVVSIGGIEILETDASSCNNNSSFRIFPIRMSSVVRPASDLNEVDIYPVQSSPSRSTRGSFKYSSQEVVSGVPINPVLLRSGSTEGLDQGPAGGEHEIPVPLFDHFDLHELDAFDSKGRYSIDKSEEIKSDQGGSLRGSRKVTGGGEALQSQNKLQETPPATITTKLVLFRVWRKLIRNPNMYASLLGVAWSLVSNRWDLKMPSIMAGCVSIISNTGLGMSVFSLGLFTASQPKIIACGKKLTGMSMAVRFLLGPAVMAATSLAVGIRGKLLHIAIIQAALPPGLATFVFAKEYDVHADIMSTSVIFGTLIALPVAILYNLLLEL